jgi:translation initiation factor IF-2
MLRGSLRVGETILCGAVYGRVRAMRDDKGNAVEAAGPARPVEVLGLTGSPNAGESFLVTEDEGAAREIAERRAARRKARAARSTPHVTLDNLASTIKEGETKTLNLVVKADVQGSLEAITASLMKIKSDKIIIRILHAAVGGVTEGDIQLADASDAVVIGFNVRPDVAARDLAQNTGVEIKSYSIIYDLLEEMEKAMIGMLEPEYEEEEAARIEVREIFKVSKVGNVAGCYVAEGTVAKDNNVRLIRNGTVTWNGKLASLRRHKDEVKEVQAGLECGIGLLNFNDVKVGDILETYVLKRKAASLVHDTAAGE